MNIKFTTGNLDGSTDQDLPEHVYLHVLVHANEENEGQLTGYFRPEVLRFIKEALSVETSPLQGAVAQCSCADFDGFVDCPVHI